MVDRDLVLLTLDRGNAFRLNGSGKLVWELAGQGRGRQDIVERMTITFAAARADIERDVDRLLAELVDNHLLEIVTGEVP